MSFFSTGDPDIFISTVKKAEDSDEVVIRLVNMSTTGKEVTLHCFRTPQDARLTTLIEEDLHPLPVTGKEVTVELGPRAIETLKMR
jgi:alpha-mannosidase